MTSQTGDNASTTSTITNDVPQSAAAASQTTILTGPKLWLALLSLYACTFLVALDQLILTTSSPRIVSQFKALDDIAWITTSYFLSQASFMLIFGKILTIAPVKNTLWVGVFLFEAGSAICGAAPNMNVLLFGRTLSGVGAAGIFVSVFAIIANITTLASRPKYMGLAAIVFALSSVIGPLVGGAFADSSATWRWCFYINLPIGGLAAIGIFFILPSTPAPPSPDGRTGIQRITDIDFVGCLLVMGTTVCFLIPLSTGGNSFAWDSAVVITLFPVSAVLCAALLFWCHRRGERAVLPLYLLKNRSMISACIHGFFIWGAMMICSVYIPYYFQAVKGSTATHSALQLLPFTILSTFSAAVAGAFISRTGHFWPFLVAPPLLTAVGYGLMYTLGVDTPVANAYGFQILAAVGLGAGMQQNMLVPQIVYADSPNNSRMGISLVSFVAFIGRTVAISIGSTLLLSELRKELPRTLPNAPPEIIALVEASVDAVRTLPAEYKAGAVLAYARSIRLALIVGAPFAAFATLGGLLVERRKVVKKTPPSAGEEGKDMEEKVPGIMEA